MKEIIEQITDNKVVLNISDFAEKKFCENLTCKMNISDLLKLDSKKISETITDLNKLQTSLNKKGAFNLDIIFMCSCENNTITSHINSFDMLVENKLVTYTNEVESDNYFITESETITHLNGF